METIWKIRANARWHDNTPLTAEDIVFTATLDQDRSIGLPLEAGYASVERMEAPDPHTLVVTWKEPYILADSMFGSPNRLLPRHLLEQAYADDKAQLINNTYWADGFIGAGPFKIAEIERGNHVLLQAFDGYAPGRPKVDEVELKYIADSSTLVANVLAGTVDMTIGRSIAPDQAAQIRDYWTDGQVLKSPYDGDTVAVFPQLLNPTLPVIKDHRFRQALLHAMDREEMAATIIAGWAGVAHTEVTPALPEFDRIQGAVVRYEYDPRKTAQLLEEIGYQRGASGAWQDASGQLISFQNWAATGDSPERVRGMLATTDYWKRVGLDVEPFFTPPGMDRAAAIQFPAFVTKGGGGDYLSLTRYFHSSFAPTAENRFSGINPSRVMDPELDRRLEGFFSSIPTDARTRALSEVVRYESEQALWMGYYYNPQLTLVSNRLRDVTPSSYASKGFNAHLWNVS